MTSTSFPRHLLFLVYAAAILVYSLIFAVERLVADGSLELFSITVERDFYPPDFRAVLSRFFTQGPTLLAALGGAPVRYLVFIYSFSYALMCVLAATLTIWISRRYIYAFGTLLFFTLDAGPLFFYTTNKVFDGCLLFVGLALLDSDAARRQAGPLRSLLLAALTLGVALIAAGGHQATALCLLGVTAFSILAERRVTWLHVVYAGTAVGVTLAKFFVQSEYEAGVMGQASLDFSSHYLRIFVIWIAYRFYCTYPLLLGLLWHHGRRRGRWLQALYIAGTFTGLALILNYVFKLTSFSQLYAHYVMHNLTLYTALLFVYGLGRARRPATIRAGWLLINVLIVLGLVRIANWSPTFAQRADFIHRILVSDAAAPHNRVLIDGRNVHLRYDAEDWTRVDFNLHVESLLLSQFFGDTDTKTISWVPSKRYVGRRVGGEHLEAPPFSLLPGHFVRLNTPGRLEGLTPAFQRKLKLEVRAHRTELHSGETFRPRVVITNRNEQPLHSGIGGDYSLVMYYRWLNLEDGTTLGNDVRIPLEVDIHERYTQPVAVEVPFRPGRWRLDFHLLAAGRERLEIERRGREFTVVDPGGTP